MARKRLQSLLFVAKGLRNRTYHGVFHLRTAFPYSTGQESCEEDEHEEEILPSEWYERAFSKMNRWSHSLKEVDLIGGRLVNVNDHSRILDHRLEQKMLMFKSIARIFIGLPSNQETMRKNMMDSFDDSMKGNEFQFFSKKNEREPLTVNSLTKVADILSVSAQQRKVVRHKICPQVTQHQIWTSALEDILNGLKAEVGFFMNQKQNKEILLAQQIVVGCLKFLESATSYDPESTSWMRLAPAKGADSSASPKWEDVLEMCIDLINCLSDEEVLAFHVSKLEVMKEGLYQIRDVLIDKNIGYRETRYQENLVQKKLTKNLGHSSRCLFILLLYYLYGSVGDIEVDLRGGVHATGSKVCLYMGKILTVDEDMVLWNGVKQLDRGLGLFKFVWEASGMKGDLQLQGHLWCVGSDGRTVPYKGNMYFLHGINL